MKLTKTRVMVAAGVGIVVVAVCIAISTLSGPKDTPIVVAGGSIYGNTHFTDSEGWTQQAGYYAASLHPGHFNSKDGIDSITLSGFDNNPSGTITGTGGWAISVSNADPQNNPKDYALRLCSDATCSASKKHMDESDNPHPCQGTMLTKTDPVNFGVRSDSRLEQKSIFPSFAKISQLRFHDSDLKCDGPSGSTETACDTIPQITLETCNQSYPTFTCHNNKGLCSIKIGHWWFG